MTEYCSQCLMPSTRPRVVPSDFSRFWSKVDKSAGPDACWPWTACKLPRGYGRFRIGGRVGCVTPAHRIAYEMAVGPVPVGMMVLHSCDNPPCCNPAHLKLGTHVQNMEEMRQKNRSRTGERNVNARLDEGRVRRIRELYQTGNTTAQALASMFGVSEATVFQVIWRKTWRHV